MNSKETLAYAAGLIDGEGCFYFIVDLRGVAYPALQVVIGHKATIEWLAQQFGGTVRTRKATGRNEDCYEWKLKRKEDLLRLLPALIEYLRVKRANALVMFDFCCRFRYKAPDEDTSLNYHELARKLNSVGAGSAAIKEELHKVLNN